VFVFMHPWDNTIAFRGIGALSRVVGLAAFATALLTVALRSRVRKPPAIFWLAAAFVTSSAVTLLWTISPDETVQRIQTYAQLLGSVWIFQEFVRTQEQHESLLFAFCLGALVPVANLMNNFVHGRQAARFVERYTSGGLLYINADGLALILVMA